MQIGEASFYASNDGSGVDLLNAGDPTLAIHFGPESNYPGGEGPAQVLDADSNSKYLNFGKADSGLIISRADGLPAIVDSLTFTAANDAPERDPLTWELFGTNDAITSADNSTGMNENWTLVDTGDTGLAADPGRQMPGLEQLVSNNTAYSAYRIHFPTLRDEGAANSMQVGGIVFGGTVVPEPASLSSVLLLSLVASASCLRPRR